MEAVSGIEKPALIIRHVLLRYNPDHPNELGPGLGCRGQNLEAKGRATLEGNLLDAPVLASASAEELDGAAMLLSSQQIYPGSWKC
jgi:hypothetical protein